MAGRSAAREVSLHRGRAWSSSWRRRRSHAYALEPYLLQLGSNGAPMRERPSGTGLIMSSRLLMPLGRFMAWSQAGGCSARF